MDHEVSLQGSLLLGGHARIIIEQLCGTLSQKLSLEICHPFNSRVVSLTVRFTTLLLHPHRSAWSFLPLGRSLPFTFCPVRYQCTYISINLRISQPQTGSITLLLKKNPSAS